MKKLISLLLCAVMVMGMLPILPVSAATVKTEKDVLVASTDANGLSHGAWTTVTEEHEVPERPTAPATPVQQRSVTPNESGEYYFESFEELKEIASQSFSQWTTAYYQGSEDLVISEDLVLPDNLGVFVWDAAVIVPENVTLNILEHVGINTFSIAGTVQGESFYADALYVSGTASFDTGNLTYAEVIGQLIMNGNLYIQPHSDIIGMDNIVFTNEWNSFIVRCEASNTASLQEAVALANATTDQRIQFEITFTHSAPWVLTESVTIPANVVFVSGWTDAGLTVAEDVTLTLYCGNFYVELPMTIRGTLENNSWMYIESGTSGLLEFAECGVYSGNGTLTIFCDPDEDYRSLVPGLDMTNLRAAEYNDYSHYWELTNMAGLTQLGTPTELRWGYDEVWHWDEATGSSYVTLEECLPGAASWKTALPDQNEADVNFYRVNGDTDEYWTGSVWGFGSMDHAEYRAVDTFVMSDPESGDYYFTVTSLGDGTQYYDSETAVSDIWTYVKPDAQLGACSTPVWEGYNEDWQAIVYSWDAPADDSYVAFYEEELYFAPTEDAELQHVGSSWGGSYPSSSLWDGRIQENGVGYYYVRVRAISSDLTKYCNGPWSELSLAYNVTEIAGNIQNQLDSIISDSGLSAEEKVDAVRDLDNNDLKTAMLAAGIVSGQLLALEYETAGGPADIAVTEEASAFDASKIDIVGANLNTTVDDAEGVTLIIDKPKDEHIIPEAYNNSVAVSFSMDLENVEDTENLEVPVKITLPVPASINPAFLVILHYHANGEVEEIWPYVETIAGETFASFVLTSFSDFILTEVKVESENNGDLNADGSVDDSDVALLLWHTLFSDAYPISGNGDINGDGEINDADVAYLLWHTLFPQDYPLA